MKTRVLCFHDRYPQLSETYLHTEIEALRDDYEIRIVTRGRPDLPRQNHFPFERITHSDRLFEIIGEFRPHVLHTHYLTMMPVLARIAAAVRLPYTVRAHSFDAIPLHGRLPVDDLCQGVLAFPFTRSALEAAGIPRHKIVDCHPVVDYARFHDPSPNGDAILNVGPGLPKKRFEDFIELARLAPGRRFDLYCVGYLSEELQRHNERLGSPATIHAAVQPEQMPQVYKAHGWLVYTACRELNTVGWPMAIAEAQAAGLGICMQRLRPDLAEYLGGAGFLYDSVDELPEILSRPYPEEMRARGFEQAKKSDIRRHKDRLSSLWDACADRLRSS